MLRTSTVFKATTQVAAFGSFFRVSFVALNRVDVVAFNTVFMRSSKPHPSEMNLLKTHDPATERRFCLGLQDGAPVSPEQATVSVLAVGT